MRYLITFNFSGMASSTQFDMSEKQKNQIELTLEDDEPFMTVEYAGKHIINKSQITHITFFENKQG